MTFYAGDPIRYTETFTTNDGVLTDPGTVTFRFLAPDLTLSTFVHGVDAEVIRESVGVFRCDTDIGVAAVGVWEAACVGTDPLPKTGSQRWTVTPPL